MDEKVDRSGGPEACHSWLGASDRAGYGSIFLGEPGRRNEKVHVLVWEWAHGARKPRGMVVRHTCDEPSCVNPAHLVVGTQAENIADMHSRGRANNGFLTRDKARPWGLQRPENMTKALAAMKTGDARHNTRLSDASVREVRRLSALGEPDTALAIKFGVSRSLVYQVRTGRRRPGVTSA